MEIDYYDLHDCLETVEKKTDYKMWFSGHYHDDHDSLFGFQ